MSFSKILTPRPVGHSLTRQNLKEQLERNIFPRQVVEEHITGVIENTSNESNTGDLRASKSNRSKLTYDKRADKKSPQRFIC